MQVELDANQLQIQRLVSSKTFKTSEVHRNLLTYLAEKSLSGDAQNLKEYTVGLDVFGKPSTYDLRQESVVRMHVGRLRQKLTEYYRTEGADDQIVIDLPKGGFALTFATRPPAVEAEAPPPVAPARTISHREVTLAALLAVAVLAAGYLAVRLLRVSETTRSTASGAAQPWTPDLQELWSPLLSSDRPLMVTLATGAAGSAGSSASVTGVGKANAAFMIGQLLGQRQYIVFSIWSV